MKKYITNGETDWELLKQLNHEVDEYMRSHSNHPTNIGKYFYVRKQVQDEKQKKRSIKKYGDDDLQHAGNYVTWMGKKYPRALLMDFLLNSYPLPMYLTKDGFNKGIVQQHDRSGFDQAMNYMTLLKSLNDDKTRRELFGYGRRRINIDTPNEKRKADMVKGKQSLGHRQDGLVHHLPSDKKQFSGTSFEPKINHKTKQQFVESILQGSPKFTTAEWKQLQSLILPNEKFSNKWNEFII